MLWAVPEATTTTTTNAYPPTHPSALLPLLPLLSQVKSAVGAAGGKLELHWGSTLYHLDDLPFKSADLQDLPDVFTPFKQKVEDRCSVRPCLPPPRRGALPLPAGLEPGALDFQPRALEELSAALRLPAGQPQLQLATPQRDPRVGSACAAPLASAALLYPLCCG
jgi:deoxyribodipyrimidine photo-lyase